MTHPESCWNCRRSNLVDNKPACGEGHDGIETCNRYDDARKQRWLTPLGNGR